MKSCSMDGCDKPAFARTWCRNHYARWFRNGDPNGANTTKPGEPQAFIENVAIPHEGDDCLIWPFNRSRFGYARIREAGSGKLLLVHRIVCEAVHGAPFEGAHTAHSCGSGHMGCINPKHLRWATRQENAKDKILHGTSQRGAANGNAVLTEQQVLEIRALKGKYTQKIIAADFGVCRQIVSLIQRREAWGWLD